MSWISRFVCVVAGSVLIVPAQGASFDCAKAGTSIEKLICGNDKLSRADDAVELAYLRALERTNDRQKLINDQRNWLKDTRNKCTNADCIFKTQVDREYALDAIPGSKCYWLEPPMKDASGSRPPVDPMCGVMEENLNQFCNKPPMVCELRIAPQFSKQIALPVWTYLDPDTNRAKIEEFIRAPYEASRKKFADQIWAEEQPKLVAAFQSKRISFSQAQLDIYNLGVAQTVYRLDYGNCEANNPQLAKESDWAKATHYQDVKTQFAPEITRQLFHDYFSVDRYLAEVFLYEGKIYDFTMGGVENPATGLGENQLIISRHGREVIVGAKPTLNKRNICIFNYRPLHITAQ